MQTSQVKSILVTVNWDIILVFSILNLTADVSVKSRMKCAVGDFNDKIC